MRPPYCQDQDRRAARSLAIGGLGRFVLVVCTGTLVLGGCTQQMARLPLGSDHFVAMQHLARSVVFAKAIVELGKDCGGRADGSPDLKISEASVMKELRLALLDAYYDGPDLERSGPGASYEMATDMPYLHLTVQFACETPAGEEFLFIEMHGARFTLNGYGFYQDSFQSARLARLIRDRLLPPKATQNVIQAVESLASYGNSGEFR